ncbi:phage tail protein I [Kosakonia oryzendophytica]|uniref:phage tail protein I n=1 Tax=Kosakonia TaxID=1330547 RepID=UPI0021D91CBA|nr:phage tail protein I [Kosakonia sp. ML.JS2a]UXY12113.1 phage tail protein I [Kosakonia sp. ML.JS2a]
MNDDRLLPVGSSGLEVAATTAAAQIERVPVPLRTLWDPQKCPAELLPYLAWALSVDRWDYTWPEATKRNVIAASFYVHQHKGTLSALHRVVEPLGFLIELREWWQDNAEPGTFKLVIGVQDNGITEAMYEELERLIDDAKPASRHLTSLNISLSTQGEFYVGAGCYLGEELTVYPYAPEEIVVGGESFPASAVHLIDDLRVNP